MCSCAHTREKWIRNKNTYRKQETEADEKSRCTHKEKWIKHKIIYTENRKQGQRKHVGGVHILKKTWARYSLSPSNK